MKTQRNILIAFLLNLFFSIFEFIGGSITGSVAIISDAVHDLGDAISIGLSYFLEKKSQKEPDQEYTYGYVRYSVLGGFITTLILLLGSIFVVYKAVGRILDPVEVNYDGMIVFAIIGLVTNFLAAYITRKGDSINQKAVNLHMLEDVLGWAVVLIGAIVMRFTDWSILDPILSIGVAVFIFYNAFNNLNKVVDLFLEKTPSDIDIKEIKDHIQSIEGVEDVHHVHVWSLDGSNHYATMHVVTDMQNLEMKEKIRNKLKKEGIVHLTIEFESTDEPCLDHDHKVDFKSPSSHHH